MRSDSPAQASTFGDLSQKVLCPSSQWLHTGVETCMLGRVSPVDDKRLPGCVVMLNELPESPDEPSGGIVPEVLQLRVAKDDQIKFAATDLAHDERLRAVEGHLLQTETVREPPAIDWRLRAVAFDDWPAERACEDCAEWLRAHGRALHLLHSPQMRAVHVWQLRYVHQACSQDAAQAVQGKVALVVSMTTVRYIEHMSGVRPAHCCKHIPG
mmetsp:Transcript_52761/g.122796  ORF Transcript_52761/g.122796 Transcript_52761/m.122796 type:complete len:212 (-) Transcript_52761:307-942(-)